MKIHKVYQIVLSNKDGKEIIDEATRPEDLYIPDVFAVLDKLEAPPTTISINSFEILESTGGQFFKIKTEHGEDSITPVSYEILVTLGFKTGTEGKEELP